MQVLDISEKAKERKKGDGYSRPIRFSDDLTAKNAKSAKFLIGNIRTLRVLRAFVVNPYCLVKSPM
jgi:hypothetical protein